MKTILFLLASICTCYGHLFALLSSASAFANLKNSINQNNSNNNSNSNKKNETANIIPTNTLTIILEQNSDYKNEKLELSKPLTTTAVHSDSSDYTAYHRNNHYDQSEDQFSKKHTVQKEYDTPFYDSKQDRSQATKLTFNNVLPKELKIIIKQYKSSENYGNPRGDTASSTFYKHSKSESFPKYRFNHENVQYSNNNIPFDNDHLKTQSSSLYGAQASDLHIPLNPTSQQKRPEIDFSDSFQSFALLKEHSKTVNYPTNDTPAHSDRLTQKYLPQDATRK